MMRTDWRAEELKPGARVEWEQFTAEGFAGMRQGEVWDRAPDVDGCRAVAWVVPDEREDYDPYPVLAVGIASRSQPLTDDSIPNTWIGKGHLFTSCRPSTGLGGLATGAANHARNTRSAR